MKANRVSKKIWGFATWLKHKGLAHHIPSFNNLNSKDIFNLTHEDLMKINIYGDDANQILVQIGQVGLQTQYLQSIKAVIEDYHLQGPKIGIEYCPYNIVKTLKDMKKIIMPTERSVLMGNLCDLFVEVLSIIFADIDKVNDARTRLECLLMIYRLCAMGKKNKTFKKKQLHILEQWRARYFVV